MKPPEPLQELIRRTGARGAVILLAAALIAGTLFMLRGRDGGDLLDPGGPEVVADLAPGPDVPASLIAAPIRIPVTRLTELLERAVPTEHGDLGRRQPVRGRDRAEVAFQLQRDPFVVLVEDGVATVRTTIRYALRAYYDPPLLPALSGSCGVQEGTDKPRIEVALRTPLSVDREWRLRTRARVVHVTPASDGDRDRCRMTFLNLDFTDQVLDAARRFIDEHLGHIDALAADVDVHAPVASWWRTLQQPIRLTDSLWLAMRPEAVQRGPVVGSGDVLELAMALKARPAVHYGDLPALDTLPLPHLGAGEVAPGLDLRVEARVDYQAVTGLLFDELAGREFVHDGRRIRLDSLSVYGVGGGRLAVELRVSGDVRARLYLVGTPRIDPVTADISVPDLDFDVATRDVVLATATWLRAAELRRWLRERARWPAAPAVERITHWVATGLNRELSDDLSIRGDVASIRILDVHARREVLLVRIAMTGAGRLIVTGDAPPAPDQPA